MLLEAYGTPVFDGLQTRVSCAWSLCRVDLEFDSSERVEQLARAIPTEAPWMGQGLLRLDTETRRGVFFLSREDYDLPKLQ